MGLLNNNQSIDVTSMECTRFLFPLSEAVKTVLGTLYYSQGGEVFIPQINSFKMGTVINAIQKIMNLDNIDYHIRGMRPGEKIHEDMLAKTELDFTYEVTDKLLAVTPQYTNRTHSFKNKYKGLEFNSSLHTNDNVDNLVKLINIGLQDESK
jgi:FlaA1/EpsC-like NDP-sugar epimerase